MPRRKKQPEVAKAPVANIEPPILEQSNALTGYAAQELQRRPSGPRARNLGDERGLYTGPNVRLSRVTDNQADEFFIAINKPLTGESLDGEPMFVSRTQADRLHAGGFDDISDRANGSLWQADARKIRELETDLNVLAVMLDRKGERLAEGHGR